MLDVVYQAKQAAWSATTSSVREGAGVLLIEQSGRFMVAEERIGLRSAGQIRSEIERYSMDDALEAYRQLESGQLSGRAVVTPHT